MEVIKKFNVNNTMDLYALTKSPDRKKLSDYKGKEMELDAWVLCEDERKGESFNILCIRDKTGIAYATNSATFIREFTDAVSMFESLGDSIHTIRVDEGTSKNGRTYITCVVLN